jgi:AraC-like DNA-binding protein
LSFLALDTAGRNRHSLKFHQVLRCLKASPLSLASFQVLVNKWDFFESPCDRLDRVLFVVHGTTEVISAGQVSQLGAKQVFFVPAGVPTVLKANCPLEIKSIEFDRDLCFADPDSAAFFDEVMRLWAAREPLDGTCEIAQAAGAVFSALRGVGQARGAALIAARGRLLGLLAALHQRLLDRSSARSARLAGNRFEASLEHIQANLGRRIGVSELAGIAGLGRRQYAAVFRKRTGQSVARYVRSARVRFAQGRLLEAGDILQASLDAGFADLSNFYRIFKAEFGVTPRQYIEGRMATAPAQGPAHAHQP